MTTADTDARRWRLAAAAAVAAAATGAIALCRMRQKQVSDNGPVDFASFLVTPVATDHVEERSRWGSRRKAAAQATSFDNFLKQRADAADDGPDPADFATFLRDGGGGRGGAASAAGATPPPPKAAETIPPDRAPVLVLYGTEYGFAREIAEKLADAMKKMGGGADGAPPPKTATLPWPCVVDMADASPGLLAAQQAALLVCSTQGDGVPPTEARRFCEWVFAGCKAEEGVAAGGGKDGAPTKAAATAAAAPPRHSVLALGDTSYAHFCRCGKMLDAALSDAGSKTLVPRVDVDKEDWRAVDGWIAAVLAALPPLALRPLSALGGAAAAVALNGGGGGGVGKALAWGKSRPFPARVVAVELLCKPLSSAGGGDVNGVGGRGADWRSEKVTARVELDISGSGPELEGYLPGDALGIYPLNAPQDVEALLGVLAGAKGAAAGAAAEALGASPVPTPSWHYAELEPAEETGPLRPPVAAPRPAEMPLREALARCYDLRAPKGEPLLRALRGALSLSLSGGAGGGKDKDEDEAQRLDALLAGGKDALDAYLEPRHVIDVLREHPVATAAAFGGAAGAAGGGGGGGKGTDAPPPPPPPLLLLSCLRQLQPRLYSISSSPLEAPGRVQATIAVVRYESLGEERTGVCSTYAAERVAAAAATNGVGGGGGKANGTATTAAAPAATTMRVYIHRNPDFRLPPDPSTPIVMVGPGTGLAPFRAFILERLLGRRRRRQSKTDGKEGDDGGGESGAENMVLFFGSRRRDQDYLYGDQLEAWAREGLITLHTAFSRQPGQPKVYVQRRLREQGERVWRLLSEARAHFYVCGDAAGMAPAVEEELLRLMRDRGGLTGDEAAARLKAMAADGRYQRDVWFG